MSATAVEHAGAVALLAAMALACVAALGVRAEDGRAMRVLLSLAAGTGVLGFVLMGYAAVLPR